MTDFEGHITIFPDVLELTQLIVRHSVGMSEPKATGLDYSNFLVVTPLVFIGTEAARRQSTSPRHATHDALIQLLHRLAPDHAPLWEEARRHVILHSGLVIVDDTTLDSLMPRKSNSPIATDPANTIA